ncbi:phosphorylase superfamily protein [Collimonas arenae]|uniref:Phosphorylase superfamily protein n=1 Tax=Collimonas arenae TaxID=279058 RepID=A0A127PUL6_9BURK|nr:response regulator [Collimonas arenae]AMP01538.1 phosphorylase superfamily protein [Collimonas arenae]AMP11432.1 phosphorylase superfamily protein [Collimonas arenae]
MLKILIVDDSPARFAFFDDDVIGKFASANSVDHAGNVKDALRKLGEVAYDVLIVDIMLPATFWAKEPAPLGGIDLLTHLLEDECLHRPKYIIGVTSATDLDPVISTFFDESPWVLLRDSTSMGSWEGRLTALLAHADTVEKKARSVNFDIDICIVTALADPEQKAILQWPIAWNTDPIPVDSNTNVRKGTLTSDQGESMSVVLACSRRMGSTESACLTSKVIERFRPRIIAMAGICAGLEGAVNLGDAILGSPVWDWTSSKWDVDKEGIHRALPAPHYMEVSPEVTSRFKLLQDDKQFLERIRTAWPASPPSTALGLHIGPCASGPIVVADGKTLEKLKLEQNRQILGLEMEAYGVYYAAQFAGLPRPLVMSVKSVCDFADPRKNDAMQKYAAYTSAQILYEFLRRHASSLKQVHDK